MSNMFEVLGAAVEKTTTALATTAKATSPVPVKVVEPNRDLKLVTHQAVPALLAGFVGSVLWPKHPVLGFFGAAAVVGNIYPLTQPEERKRAAFRIGVVGAAIAGSLALKKHPVVGYLGAGAAAALVVPMVVEDVR